MINGKPVKYIIVDKGWKKAYFAKPKRYDVETPHFEQKTNGTLQVHQHSLDCKLFRVMTVSEIYSGSLNSGSSFVHNKGLDMALLPMNETANGFTLDFSSSGSSVTVTSGSQWVLMAFGKYGEYRNVPQKKTQQVTK